MVAGARQTRRARKVTYSTLGTLLLVALIGFDFWPLSAFRLFSDLRTEETGRQELIVSLDGGAEETIDCVRHDVLRQTMRFVPQLPEADVRTRDVMLDTWLAECGIDRDSVESVRINQLEQVIDPVTLEWSVVSRTTVWSAEL